MNTPISPVKLGTTGLPRYELKYLLGGEDGKTILETPNLFTWARWMEEAGEVRRVAKDTVKSPTGELIQISTVFLGLDHNFTQSGPPILFESMIFGGDEEINQGHRRYATWEEAEAGHKQMVNEVKKHLLLGGSIFDLLKNKRAGQAPNLDLKE